MLDNLDTLLGFALISTVVSLLVTIVVQMVMALLKLRSQNLAWALAETFETIEPKLTAEAKGLGKHIADHVLRDTLLADQQIFWFKPSTTAVRPDELFDLLHRIATDQKKVVVDDRNLNPEQKKQKEDEIKGGVVLLFKALGLAAPPAPAGVPGVPAVPEPALAKLKEALALLPEGPAKADALQSLETTTARMTELVASAGAEAAKAATAVQAQIQAAYQKFEAWLNTGQERAQDWFALHAKVVTLCVGLLAAFFLQLDTIEIFKTVSTNKGLRDKLVAQTSTVVGQAETMLSVPEDVLQNAYEAWKSNSVPVVKAALQKQEPLPGKGDTRCKFVQRIETKLKDELKDVSVQATLDTELQKLGRSVDLAAKEALAKESANYKKVKGDLDNTGFVLFPLGNGRWDSGWFSRDVFVKHGWGMFFSVLLLSLGAPFWFNALKSLASLRSAVASNITAEDKAAQKPGSPPATSSAPPTVTQLVPPAAVKPR